MLLPLVSQNPGAADPRPAGMLDATWRSEHMRSMAGERLSQSICKGMATEPDNLAIARLNHTRTRFDTMFPKGVVPITDARIQATAQYEWVTETLGKQDGMISKIHAIDLPDPWLPCARHQLSHNHLHNLCKGGAPITDEAVERGAGQGWAHREFETRERAALEAVRAETSREMLTQDFIASIRACRDDGHGDWYKCGLRFGRMSVDEARRFVALAQRHPDDVRAQEAACRALSAAALTPQHLDASTCNAALTALLASEALPVVMAAMRLHCTEARLQFRACEVLWRATDSATTARIAEATGAVHAVATAMARFPREKSVQIAACGVLLNIAKHREKTPLQSSLVATIPGAASAMSNFVLDLDVQGAASAYLWQLAAEEPAAIATRAGLKTLVEHAATTGVKEARWLLETICWQSSSKEHASRGGGRRRWGQWATGRHAAT
mmetsp:Transcript_53266/g.105889  ORF Transcript_53266/g.105889 Transcript_53266/m.105889 type:complete len:441 (-) Transcript_53266:117-1439(-)